MTPRIVLARAYPEGGPVHWHLAHVLPDDSHWPLCGHLHGTAEAARTCVEAQAQVALLTRSERPQEGADPE